MELAKNWDPKKTPLPAYAQIKYDGVPLTFIRPADGGPVQALTRQNELALSVPHLLVIADILLLTPGASFTAECFVHGLPFKDSSGIIRRQTPDEDTAKIVGMIFDASIMAHHKDSYFTRIRQIENSIKPMRQTLLQVAPYWKVENEEQVEAQWEWFKANCKATDGGELEGMMLHDMTKPFQPGKRCWGMGRYKPQPTLDLRVVRYVEAVSEEGNPLNMVGRIEVQLHRRWEHPTYTNADDKYWVDVKEVGIGPGKMTHEERHRVWAEAEQILNSGGPRRPKHPTIAEVKYMPDPSYDALRQATFQRFRPDKETPDVLEY